MTRHDPALAALTLLAMALEAFAVALRPLLAHALALLLTAAGWRPAQKEGAELKASQPPITPTKEPPAPVRTAAPRSRTRKARALAVA